MTTTPYHGFRFPKAIIQHTIWLYYLSFTLSLRYGVRRPAEARVKEASS